MLRNIVFSLFVVVYLALTGCGGNQALLKQQQESARIEAERARMAFVADSLAAIKAAVRADSIQTAVMLAQLRADSLAKAMRTLAGKKVAIYRSVGGASPDPKIVAAFEGAGATVVNSDKAKWGRWPHVTLSGQVRLFLNPTIYNESDRLAIHGQIRDLFGNKRMVPINNFSKSATKAEIFQVEKEYGDDTIVIVYFSLPSGNEPVLTKGMKYREYEVVSGAKVAAEKTAAAKVAAEKAAAAKVAAEAKAKARADSLAAAEAKAKAYYMMVPPAGTNDNDYK